MVLTLVLIFEFIFSSEESHPIDRDLNGFVVSHKRRASMTWCPMGL